VLSVHDTPSAVKWNGEALGGFDGVAQEEGEEVAGSLVE
jgi:hypothetical protein